MKKKTKNKSKTAVASAATPAAAVMESSAAESLTVARSKIMPSPTNPRKTFPQAALQELADSIRAQGLIQPIVVRRRPVVAVREPDMADPHWVVLKDGVEVDRFHESLGMAEKLARGYAETNGTAEFEIIAGERRWRASELADLKEVPIIVRNMTDHQVIEAQHVENLQREDVSPAEEAESYKKLIDSKIHTVESLAERLGIKRSTLYLRLKLTRLSPKVRELVDAKRMPYTVAELVGRIPSEKLQGLACEKLMKGEYEDQPNGEYLANCVSFRRAKEILEDDFTVDLKGAPFDTEQKYDGKIKGRGFDTTPGSGDWDLNRVGPCSTCPRRSGNCKEEFPDIESPNVCTDPDCFAAKRSAHEKLLRQEHEASGAKVLTGKDAQKCFNYYGDEPANGYVKLDAEYPGTGKSIKKLLKGAEPTKTIAIIKGKAKTVYHLQDVHDALKAAGVEVKAPKKETQEDGSSYAKRQAEIEARKKQLEPIALEARKLLLARAAKGLDEETLLRLLLADEDGCGLNFYQIMRQRKTTETKLRKEIEKMDAKELRLLIYEEGLLGEENDMVTYQGEFSDLLVSECKRNGIDLEKLANELKLEDAPKAEGKKKGAKK